MGSTDCRSLEFVVLIVGGVLEFCRCRDEHPTRRRVCVLVVVTMLTGELTGEEAKERKGKGKRQIAHAD